MAEKCRKIVIRRGKQVECGGKIIEVPSRVPRRRETEIDYVCDSCGQTAHSHVVVRDGER